MEQYISKEFPDGASVEAALLRAKSGGAIDITLQNNDPRNWGLGAYAKDTSDLDSITDTGWNKGTPLVDGDNTLGSSVINHIRLGETDNAVQIAYTNAANSWDGCIMLIREKKAGTWDPWNYVNPQMRIGTEYRTTERWNGSPVYAQLFDCSPLPNATTKVFPVEGTYADNVSVVVDYGGMSTYFGQSLQNKGFASLNVTQSKIYIMTENDLSAGNAYVWVKYVKSA